MKTLLEAVVTAKNMLSVDAPWIVLVELTLPDTSIIRLARNRENVEYDGENYTAMSMNFAAITQSSDGKLPSVVMQVANPTRALEPYLHLNDGLTGCAVSLILIYDPDSPVLADEWRFVVSHSASTEEWVEIELGALNLYQRRIPRDRYIPGFCRHVFRGAVCQFTGGEVGPLDTIAFTATDTITIPGDQTGDLAEGQRIAVSGSAENDGEFEIDTVAYSSPNTTVTVIEAVETEAAGESITVTVICDHQLVTCRANQNSERFGGSPGMDGGVYA